MRRIALSGVLALFSFVHAAHAQSGLTVRGGMTLDSRWLSQTYTLMDLGEAFTVALPAGGVPLGWGRSNSGQLSSPISNLASPIIEIATGEVHAVAQFASGLVIGWGQAPALPAATPGNRYMQVAAGGFHTLGLLTNGTVVAVGQTAMGQCDVPVLPTGVNYVAVGAGRYHSLAQRSDGVIVGFGSNAHGQSKQQVLPPGVVCIRLTGGDDHSVACLSDGSVLAWGRDIEGQCKVPANLPGVTYTGVDAGARHTVALRSDGSVVAFGANDVGQSQAPASSTGFVRVRAYGNSSCALGSNGSLSYWGDLSNGVANDCDPPTNHIWMDASPGAHVLALASDGSVLARGWNAAGQCNVPALSAGQRYVEIDGGFEYSLARRNDGWIVAFGANQLGQCNVPALQAGVTYVEQDSGGRHSLARRSDGTVVAFGDNAYGQCDVPALPPGVRYIGVGAGFRHSIALRSDGKVIGWGDLSTGALTPPALPAGTSVVSISADGFASAALLSDGRTIAWGGGVQPPAPPVPGLRTLSIAVSHYWGQVFSLRSDGELHPLSTFPKPPFGKRYARCQGSLIGAAAVQTAAPLPAIYCGAKTTSNGCTPVLDAEGIASASAPEGLRVHATRLRNRRPGMLIYGLSGRAALPFSLGTLCVAPPHFATPSANSSGNPPPADDCSGRFSIDMNGFAQGRLGGSPHPALRSPGTVVDCQYWGRDPGIPPRNDYMLSNGVEYVITL